MAETPSPDSNIPGVPSGPSSLPYVIGILVFAAAGVGLLVWKNKSATPPPSAPEKVVATATATATAEAAPQFAHAPPPPPPPEEEPDAGAAKSAAPKSTGAGTAAPAGLGPCTKCDAGKSSGALNSALSGTASTAQGCYNRALRSGGEISGSVTVSVQVGQSGQVCSASIVNDTLHSGEVTSCVLGKFRGKSFPPPQSGCVTVNIPISFKPRQ